MTPRPLSRLLSLLALAVLPLATGCVERTLVVETEPAGAIVYLDEERIEDELGEPARTPVEIPFQFYGTRQLVVRHPGYRSRQEMVELSAPAYDFFPLDLFTELLIPYTFEDVHRVSITLDPVPPPSEAEREAILGRADAFRRNLPPDEPATPGP